MGMKKNPEIYAADISPKTGQTLARHSDIRLTMDVYTHVDREEQIAAIHSLPSSEEGEAA